MLERLVTAYDVTECDLDVQCLFIGLGSLCPRRKDAAGAVPGMPDKRVNHVWAHAGVLWRVTRSPVGARGVFECAGGEETATRMSHGRKTLFQPFRSYQCATAYQ